MSELENLIREAETDINRRAEKRAVKTTESLRLPRFSVAIIIWLIAILLAAFEFDTVLAPFSDSTDNQIERNLEDILTASAASLRNYEIANGSLPPLLPNPSIRGLVKYQRHNDFSFRLVATIGDVTMVMDSNKAHAYRRSNES